MLLKKIEKQKNGLYYAKVIIIITLVSILASMVITAISLYILEKALSKVDLTIAIIAPLIICPPISLMFLKQNYKKKESEALAELYRTRLAFHIQNTPIAVIDWDINFRINSWNNAAETIFGYRYSEVIGKYAKDLINTEQTNIILDEIKNTLKNKKENIKSINENITKEGKIILCEWFNTPILDENEIIIGVSSLVMNITEQKLKENELKEAKIQAEAANKAKSIFLANMSHELRTPLNAILGFSQLLQLDKEKLSTQQIQNVGYIKESGEYLLEMISDILDLSKIESGKLEIRKQLFNLNVLLSSFPDTIKALIEKKNLEFKLEIDSSFDIINADEKRIKEILYNLLSNSIKFTDPGKSIGIRAFKKESNILIEIWDQGRGIASKDIEKIFDPFEQVGKAKHGDIKGTGLGLAITKKLIEAHEGSLSVESKLMEGSKFIITLPIDIIFK